MSLFKKIRRKAVNEFIDIVEWTEEATNTLIWRFPSYHATIKNGAHLTVREAQVAVLVNEGQFADVYKPGHHKLTTRNMPILSTLKGWKCAFNAPFKVDIYFVNTQEFLNVHWDTKSPIIMQDSEFGPIRLRAFGSYSFRVEHDPIVFIRNVVESDENFTPESISDQLSNFVVMKFTDYLTSSKIAALDLAENLNEFSSELLIALKDDFSNYGIELTKILVEKISLPESVEATRDKATCEGVLRSMSTYTQMKFANSLKSTASNHSGDGSQDGEAIGVGSDMTMTAKLEQEMENEQDGKYTVGNNHKNMGRSPQHGTPSHIPQQNMMFHIAIDGVQQGPFSQAKLQQMAQQGQLTPDTLVWTAGMPSWEVAKTVPSLSQLFNKVPPPL